MEEPTITPLVDRMLGNTLGGDSITKSATELVKNITTLPTTEGMSKGISAAFGADGLVASASIARGRANSKALSAFMVEPIGKGKVLCPSVG